MNPFIQLLFNPAIISLLCGLIIGSISRFRFPVFFVDIVSMYLIFTIGFKGGACLGVANQCTSPLILLALIGIVIGFIQPFLHYFILKKTTDLDKETTAVVASEYGSISIVTFITAITFLNERIIPYDTFMSAVAGVMEIPAIFSGMWLLKRDHKAENKSDDASFFEIGKSIVTCKKINIIFIGFFVGYIGKFYGTDFVASAVIWPFSLLLILFMLDVGVKIAKQKESMALFSPSIVAFALYMPFINGCLALLIGHYVIESLGSLILFAVILASASYIAVPAIMSMQAKNAKEAIYLPLSLGITLPFNILIGIPLYYYIALFLRS